MTLYRGLLARFEVVTVTVLELLLILTVAVATLVVIVFFFAGLRTRTLQVESLEALQPARSHIFSDVLMVLLGLELLETLKFYFREHHVRIEVILVVAMIAVGRHLIQVNFEKASALTLIGLGVLIVSLAVGYFLVCKSHVIQGLKNPSRERPSLSPSA
jgi:uncharacterized membrane protein (DUF373 family)